VTTSIDPSIRHGSPSLRTRKEGKREKGERERERERGGGEGRERERERLAQLVG